MSAATFLVLLLEKRDGEDETPAFWLSWLDDAFCSMRCILLECTALCGVDAAATALAVAVVLVVLVLA